MLAELFCTLKKVILHPLKLYYGLRMLAKYYVGHIYGSRY